MSPQAVPRPVLGSQSSFNVKRAANFGLCIIPRRSLCSRMAGQISYSSESMHCSEDHPLTEVNVTMTSTGRKVCKICSRVYRQRHFGRIIDDSPMRASNGEKTHCKKGHEFSPENTRMQKKGAGFIRVCLKCSTQHKIKARYGLSWEQYQDLLNKFDGKCWICKDGVATDIDHDHACCPATKGCKKCVRGVLCHSCNMALGLFKDDLALLRQALSYLQAKVLEF